MTRDGRAGWPRWALALALLLAASAQAEGQVISSDEWRQGTALAGFAGASSSSETRASLGGGIGWEVLPHLTIDGSGVWTATRRDASAFTALLGVRINLTPPQRVVPFASAGLGLHRASFDALTSSVPDFYRRRMATGAGLRTRYDFDDFVSSAGAGVDVYLRRHLALRPDVRVLFIRGGAATRTVGVYGVHLAYHFEEHPITP